MAVPTSITDCNATAANNSPAGSDSIGTSLDDYLRAHAAIIRQVSDDTLHLAGGTVTGQIKGITPVAAADLTRKDYVDTMLPKAGGTVTGQIKGIAPVAAEDLTRKDYVDSVVSAVNTSSGTYTPTFSSYSNCSAASVKNSRPWLYTRIGNIIHFAGTLTLTVTSTGYTYFYFTLPVAGNIADDADGSGCGYARNSADAPVAFGAYGASDIGLASWTSPGTGTTTVYINATYRIQ